MKELESFIKFQRSETTKKDYQKHIKDFFQYKNINNIEDFSNLTIDDFVDYRDYLLGDKQNSESSVNTKFRALSSFYNYLIEDRRMNLSNFAKSVARKIKPQTVNRSYLNSTQAVNLLNECKNKREFAMAMLFLNNGLRVSELIQLQLDEYNSNLGQITLIRKGGHKYTIDLYPNVKDALNEYLKVRKNSEYNNIFISNGGKPMQVNSIDRTIKKLAKRAKIDTNISAHSLRRTLATDLHRQGYGLIDIRNTLGHKSVKTTEIYIRDEERSAKKVLMAHSFLPTGGLYVEK